MKLTQSKTFWRGLWLVAVAMGGVALVKVAFESVTHKNAVRVNLRRDSTIYSFFARDIDKHFNALDYPLIRKLRA